MSTPDGPIGRAPPAAPRIASSIALPSSSRAPPRPLCGPSPVLRPVAAHLRVGRPGAARAYRRARACATASLPLHLAAISHEEGEPFALFALGAALFVVDRSAPVLARVEGADVVCDPSILAGLPADFLDGAGTRNPSTVVDLAGRWPEPAWMVSHPFPEPRVSGCRIHRRRRDRWEPAPDRIALQSFGWILPFGEDRSLVAYGEARDPDVPMRVRQIRGEPAAGCRACLASSLRLRPRHRLRARSSSPSRRRCAAGERGWAPRDGRRAVRLGARGPRSAGVRAAEGVLGDRRDRVVAVGGLPRGEGGRGARRGAGGGALRRRVDHVHPVARARRPSIPRDGAGRDAVGGRPGLRVARDRGSGGWGAVAEAALGGVVPGARAPRPRAGGAGAWTRERRAGGGERAGDVWVSASSSAGRAVFHTRPPAHVFEVPDREARWEAIRATGRSDLPLPRCNGLRVLIAPAPRDALLPALGRLARKGGLHEVTFGIAHLPEGRTILATVPDAPPAIAWCARSTGSDVARAEARVSREDRGSAPGAPAALSASGVGERGGGRGRRPVARSTRHLEGLAHGPWSDLAGVERLVELLALAEKLRLVAGR